MLCLLFCLCVLKLIFIWVMVYFEREIFVIGKNFVCIGYEDLEM